MKPFQTQLQQSNFTDHRYERKTGRGLLVSWTRQMTDSPGESPRPRSLGEPRGRDYLTAAGWLLAVSFDSPTISRSFLPTISLAERPLFFTHQRA